jgi:class 3 adenylate cyclase
VIYLNHNYFIVNNKKSEKFSLNSFFGVSQLGISRLKRLISEDLSRAFTTRELQGFIRNIDRNLDLYELTGYKKDAPIPRKDAAKEVVDYLVETKRLHKLLDLIIYTSQNGFKGEGVTFFGLKTILKEMEECGYKYRGDLKKVVYIEKNLEKRNDWGFLEDGKVYNFCFVSVDICGNSKLVREYDSLLIKDTYKNFKKMVCTSVESRKGRIWSWEGDGGLLVFHLDDFVNQSILACVDIVSSMPVFNATSNMLGEDIRIRIGLNAGSAEYKNDTASITSDSIEETRCIEKKHTEPATISISKHTVQYIDMLLRNNFIFKDINGMDLYQLRLPIRSGS